MAGLDDRRGLIQPMILYGRFFGICFCIGTAETVDKTMLITLPWLFFERVCHGKNDASYFVLPFIYQQQNDEFLSLIKSKQLCCCYVRSFTSDILGGS